MQKLEEAKARTAPPPVSDEHERHLQTTGLDLAIPFIHVKRRRLLTGKINDVETLENSLPDDTDGQEMCASHDDGHALQSNVAPEPRRLC